MSAEPLPCARVQRVTRQPFRALLEIMQKWLVGGVLGSMWLIACGGKLIDRTSPAQGGAFSASAGSSSEAGGKSAAAGGNSAAGGAPSSCVDDGIMSCADWCGSVYPNPVQGVCIEGSWRCPAPLVDIATCPAEACVRQGVSCCDHEYGVATAPSCGSDGLFAPCPVGFERNAEVCVADSANTSDCRTLLGQKSCSLAGAACNGQGVQCECDAADGGLVWVCQILLL